MSLTARKRLTAWLGLAAMWLAIFAPVISQVLAAHRAEQARLPDVAFCTVDGTTPSLSLAAAATAHAHDAANGAHVTHATHDSQGDACGYCSLLATHPPLVMPAPTGAVSFAWIARAGPATAVPPSPARPTLTPPARAPPVLS
jgi:hypothetical protein